MIRIRHRHRVAVALLAVGALVAAACEIEPVAAPAPEPLAPLEGAPPSSDAPVEDSSGGSEADSGPEAPIAEPPYEAEVEDPPVPPPPPAADGAPDPVDASEDASPVPPAKDDGAGGSGAVPGSDGKDGASGGSGTGSGSGGKGGGSGSGGGSSTSSTSAPTTSTTYPPSSGGGGSGMPEVDSSAIPTGSAGVSGPRVGTAGPPDPNDIPGAIVMFCDFSHMNFDDPIVFPGVRNATHLHSFFGNTGVNFASTAESIRNSGNSTCRGGTLNRSSYWVPSLIDTRTGAPIAPREVVIYYTHGNVPGPEVQAHPAGLRMLMGRASSTGPQQHINWYCPNGGTYTSYISTNCRSDQYIKMSLTFPQCWNGRDLDSPDHISHMAHGRRGAGCPSSHPIALPQVNLNVVWDLSGQPLSALRLSSDMYSSDQPGGYSAHADWFDGWDQATKETFVRECINRQVYCSAQLGNGQSLTR